MCFTTCVGFNRDDYELRLQTHMDANANAHMHFYLAHPVMNINYGCIGSKKCIPSLWCHYTEPGLLLLHNKGKKKKKKSAHKGGFKSQAHSECRGKPETRLKGPSGGCFYVKHFCLKKVHLFIYFFKINTIP